MILIIEGVWDTWPQETMIPGANPLVYRNMLVHGLEGTPGVGQGVVSTGGSHVLPGEESQDKGWELISLPRQ